MIMAETYAYILFECVDFLLTLYVINILNWYILNIILFVWPHSPAYHLPLLNYVGTPKEYVHSTLFKERFPLDYS